MPWFVRVHQKCSNYALTNLLFDLYMFMWIIDSLVLVPISKLQHAPFILEVMWNREHNPNCLFFYYFHFWTCIWILQGLWGCIKEIGFQEWLKRKWKRISKSCMFKDHFWKGNNKNALWWAFYCVNDNKEVNVTTPQTMHCILCHNNPILNLNPKIQARKWLIL
jgi:hypothetical protein